MSTHMNRNCLSCLQEIGVSKRVAALEKQNAELLAARLAYASEFPADANGDPDVGSIHQNIRTLKEQASRAQPERKLTDADIAALIFERTGWKQVGQWLYMKPCVAAANAIHITDAINFARSLLAAQPAAATVPEWQPIETAPKGVNGYSFMQLAWGPEEDKCIGDGMRYGDKFFAASVFHCIGKDRRYAFREHEVKPTHWMPRPQPPAAQPQDDGDAA